jgi:hypothetical protein
MRKIGILGFVGVLALVLAGCGGGDNGRVVTGPGLVGLDDTSDTTAPLLTVTYTVPPSTTSVTVSILSDLASDGDIAFDPVFSSFTVTAGPPTVLFGIDSFDIDLPEFRAFLTFPLDGFTGQPVVPSDALIVSADVEVFVNFLDFASAVPTFLDLVQYPFRNLGSVNPAIDFDAAVLATRPVFDFLASDAGGPAVRIEVTSLMQAAQVSPALVNFQVRFSRDMSVPPLAPSSPSAQVGRTVANRPRAMEGIVPRQPATADPLSLAEQAARRR